MKRQFIIFVLFFVSFSIKAQHLTISSSGQTGTSGTNWSISGNTLNIASSGSAHINTSVITNHLNNTGDLTIILPHNGVNVRDLYINNSITYTGSTARTLTFNITNDIIFASNVGISSTNASLNLVFRTALTLTNIDHGRIALNQSTLNTNGGHIWMGGGSGITTWNGLTVGNSMARVWADNLAGISIINSTINTNGGHIYMYGRSHNTSDELGSSNFGVNIENSSISSTSGSITIGGDVLGRFTHGVGTTINSYTSATTISTTSGSINILGVGSDAATNGNGWRLGTSISGSSSTVKTTISSVSGNIQIEGNANFTATINDKEGLVIGGFTEIISRSANISLKGTNTLETSGQYCNSIRFAASNVSNSIRVGFDGTNPYTGDILIEGNSIYQRNIHSGSGSIAVQTTGNLTIQPTGNAFTFMRAGDIGTLTFDNDWNFGINLGSFTYGKTTNTATITLSNDIRTNGPINVYANKINLGIGVSIITNNANGDINFLANNGFETLANSGSTRGNISPNGGGKVNINADLDNNNTGELNIDWLSFNGSTGDILVEGATLNWNTGSINELPNFFGTGGLTIRRTSNSTNTGGFSTQWIAMFDTKAFITFGHPNNIGNVNLTACTVCWQPTATNAVDKELISSGPIQVFGENIILSSNLNLTSSGNGQKILLRARNRIEIGNGSNSSSYRQLKTNNGDIVLWSNAQNAADGGIIIGDWVTLNTANGSTNQSTGGGKIWLAGGSTINADSLPTGTANGGTSRTGISFGSFSTGATTTSLYSGGGDVFINGESNATVGLGISWNRTGICHAGNGIITIKGESKNTSGAHGIELGAYSGSIDILSGGGSNIIPAIEMEGKTARNDYSGMQTNGNRMQATGAGGISIITIANNGGTSWSNNLGTNLLAASGDIFISAQGGTGLRYGGTIGKLTGSNVTTSSSNITLRSNQITINNTITVDATGQLVLEPFGTSFTNALTWPMANSSVVSGLTGLRLGKDGNTGNITITSPQSINGPISIFGGIITANANIISTNSRSQILMKGTRIIQNQGVLVQSNNGDITYNVANAPWAASSNDQGISVGVWNGSTARINAQGGNISITASFASTGQTNTGTFADVAIRFDNIEVITDKSGTINIDGNGYDNASTSGDYVWGGLYLNTLIQTDSGSISLKGTGGRSISNSRGITADLTNLKILSKFGAITLTDAMPIGHVGTNHTGAYFRPSATNAIQIGADGNLVPTSSSNIIFNVDRLTFDATPSNLNTTGTVSIRPVGNDFTSGVDLTQLNVVNSSGFTVGKSATSADGTGDASVTIGSCSIPGPISVFGGNVAINQNFNTSSGDSTANILLKSSTNIILASNRSITTNGGDVSLWADSDDNSTGYVQLLANAAISSNGGDINLGGGADLTSDYAFGTTAETCPEVVGTQYISGIHLRTGVSLNSNGGNISVRGQNANTSASAMSFGISLRGVSMNSGTGKINLNGVATGTTAVNAQGVAGWGTLTLRSANTSSDAISISGNAFTSSGSGSSLGINLVALIEATGNGGGIVLNGKSGSAPTNASVNIAGDILAISGPISLSGENSSGNYNNIFIGTTVFGKKSGTNVTSSSSNIILEGNVIATHAPVSIDCSGTLTVRPFGNSFTSTLTWPMSNVSLASSISGLTLGKSTNTANITFGSTTTIAGPITAFGGTIAVNENISSSNGSTISLFGNALTFGTNKTVTSNNGQLIIAPQNASNTIGLGGATGTLSIPASYFSTNFSDGFSNIQIGRGSQTGNIAANTFTLRDNMTFLTSGSLSLGGKPVLGNNNITLGDAISSITASASNYFQTNGNGKVISTLASNASRLFPVGNAFYNGVTITNKTNATDTFSVLIKDSVLGNGDTGRQITTPHVKATWDISKNNVNGGNGVDFDFNWNASQEVGGISTFVLNHHNDTVWQIASGTAGSVSGTTTKSMSHTGYIGKFSPFAFGPGVTPLPVELIKFNATCQSDYIQIDWTTASEIRNKSFELYKSENAQDWKFIHTEAGQGDKATETIYTFKDLDKKTSYYRLKDIDEDGIENWSQIIFSDCKNGVSDIQIYPNPATDYIKVIAPIYENTTLNIISLKGKIIKTLPLISNQNVISVKELTAGIYFIEIKGNHNNFLLKFTKN
jgi:hypothetical protein